MASKYSALKGKVPRQPTERDEALTKAMGERRDMPFSALVAEHNRMKLEAAQLAVDAKALKAKIDAVEALLEDGLDAQGADAITSQGFTWSVSYEPYPSCEDPTAIVQYFNENGMADQLTLSATELASRLKNFVKEEALANELVVTTKIVPTPDGEVEVQEVHSKIPGVKVFLKSSLSKVKAKVAQ